MNEEVLMKVREIAAELFGSPLESLHAGSSPDTVESWDSVQHLNLVLEVEQVFGVTADMENMDQLRSLGAIAEWAGGSHSQSV